jgi:hypothetical protein
MAEPILSIGRFGCLFARIHLNAPALTKIQKKYSLT